MEKVAYNYWKALPGISVDEAEEKVTAALKEQGFGILTRIDVKETLKKKLDVDHRPYMILGACNPQLAHRALTAEDSIGLLLPCNVVVAEADGGSEVALLRPEAMFKMVENPDVGPLADDAEQRIRKVLEVL